MGDVSTAFLNLIKPTRRNPDKPRVEDEAFAEMMWRQIRAFEARAIENPELLPQAVAMAQRFSEVTNVVIAANAARYAIDPRKGASMAECARLLGISKPAASQRRALGDAVMARRIEAAGAAKFSEARRERQAIEHAAEFAQTAIGAERVTDLRAYRGSHRAA